MRIFTLTDTCTLTSSSVTHSTDTFYGILCSGLIDKTQLLFTSSNSSFSQYLSNIHLQHTQFTKEINDNPYCSSQTISGRCVYHTHPSLPTSGPYLFIDTDFLSCSSSSNGSAISCSKPSASLTVERCTFDSCNCGNYSGGAIYAKSLSLLSVKNSLFSSCGGDHKVYQGGAISIESVHAMLIRENFFLKCYSSENAGALDMRNSGSEQTELPLQSSSFIHCECLTGGGASGGALEASGNACGFCSSVLFAYCKAYYGGASWLGASYFPNSICFSFFTGNNGNVSLGNDIAFHNYLYAIGDSIFLHSFTTTNDNRLACFVEGLNRKAINQDWFPHVSNIL